MAYENGNARLIRGIPVSNTLPTNGQAPTYNSSTGQYEPQTITSGTVSSVSALTLGTTGTDLSSTVANPTTTPVITLNVPTASATNRGALSAADWTTFNSKAPALTEDQNYVSDAQLIVIGNTSGTNTGDDKTAVTGILKGNGTAISAASAGTDYLTPSGSGASLTGITASQVSNTPAAGLVATTVQAATNELAFDAANTASTSLLTGGNILSIDVDPTKFNTTAFDAIFVDNSNPTSPTITRKHFNATTGNAGLYIATNDSTYITCDVNGVFHQYTTLPEGAINRSEVVLGVIEHFGRTQFEIVDTYTICPNLNVANSIDDLSLAIGFINKSGNIFSGNVSGLKINKSAGQTFSTGTNWKNNTQNPNVTTDASQTPVTMYTTWRDGAGGWKTYVTDTLQPSKYDDNTVGSPSTGPNGTVATNKWTLVLLFWSPSTNAVVTQYGQAVYNSEAEAEAAKSFSFDQNPITYGTQFRCWLILRGGATDVKLTSDAIFLHADKFGQFTSGSTTGSSITTLQGTYDNSVTPEIVTDATRGALTIKRGSAADTDLIFEAQNGAGSITWSVSGNGDESSRSISLAGNISSAAWTTNGLRLKGVPATFTDTTSSGTVASAYTDVLGGNIIASTNPTTYTNYVTGYFKDPVAGTNVTMTNKWALGSDSLRVGTSNQLTISNTGVLTATSPVFTTPNLGTPSSVTLTNATGLPISGLVASTSTAIGVGTIELGHATDTTISRVSAGVIAVEGVTIPTISSTSTLTNKSIGAGALTLEENASIALDPAGSADGKYSGITIAGTAGQALAFGDVIVLDVTAGKWFKGDISAAAGADGDIRGMCGMCVLAAAGDASATTVLLLGNCRADANFPALTIGAPVYASTTGDIVVSQPTTTDHIIRIMGFALTADEIYFNPSNDYITHV